MDPSTPATAWVIAEYQAPYADPIRVQAGEEISLDRSKTTDLVGWVWGTDRAGKGGWVPESYLEAHGDTATMRCDYDAMELSLRVGERLTLHKAESGFFWATNQAGQEGWVPATHIELCAKEQIPCSSFRSITSSSLTRSKPTRMPSWRTLA